MSDYLLDEDDITHLVGKYYTANFGEGVALHLYEDVDKPYGKPLLGQVYATQIGGRYLVAKAGAESYFMYPLVASTIAEAEKNRVGPFSKAELNNKLKQVGGDTLLREITRF